jgi:hypothetical protein
MKDSIEKYLNVPIMQAVAVLAVSTLIMCIGSLFDWSQPGKSDPLFSWSIGAAFTLFFAMLNSLLSLRAESFVKYWQGSMYSFLAVALGTSMVSWGISGIPIGEAGSYRWIYLVVSVGFIIFLTMVNFMKIIVKYAEKEEWTQPRKRR